MRIFVNKSISSEVTIKVVSYWFEWPVLDGLDLEYMKVNLAGLSNQYEPIFHSHPFETLKRKHDQIRAREHSLDLAQCAMRYCINDTTRSIKSCMDD